MLFVRKNERREVRRAVYVPCQVVRERDFKLVADLAVDLSPDGMRIVSEAELEPNEPVIVSFRTTALDLWFDTEARVTRVIRGRRPFDHGLGAGLEFLSLPRVQRFILRSHLRRVPPPVPRRAQRIDWARTVTRLAS